MEQRRIEGESLKLEVMRKAPELVVHERLSQGKGVKGPKEKKKVPGWSIDEIKEKPNIAVVEDTEEMRKWRGLSQSEKDRCLKNLAENFEEEVLDKYKVEESKREAFRGRGGPLGWRRVRKKKKQTEKSGERNVGQEISFSLFEELNLQRLQCNQEESTEEEEMKQH